MSSNEPLEYPFRAAGPLEAPKEWEQLRNSCPVSRVRLPSGDEAVLLTRYADVRQVLPLHPGSRVLAKSFTVKRISAMQPRIEAMAEQLVDDMIEHGCPADLLAMLGFPLPVWVICELLGVPDVDRDKLAHWSNAMLNLTQYSQQQVDAAQAEFNAYFAAHIADKRANPGEDLLSELIAAVDEGQQLTEQELLLIGQGVLVAGHETTSNMIGKMLAISTQRRTPIRSTILEAFHRRTEVTP